MVKTPKKRHLTATSTEQSPKNRESIVLGDYAQQVIAEQYQQMVQQRKKVLKDTDPEHLHQMRVGTRRLRTGLQAFESVVQLPKATRAKRLSHLTRALGKVRDLDVQIADLTEYYQPRLNDAEQSTLQTAIAKLQQRRSKSFRKLETALTEPRYDRLVEAYEDWLEQPQHTPIAKLPVEVALPDLLTPLLSRLLLHRGWLISEAAASGENGCWLHDLRKLCKQVRYEAEFFRPFYDQSFQDWIKEIKTLQSQLGDFQDAQVLREILVNELKTLENLPNLQQAIAQRQSEALAGWEALRQNYLDSEFRYHLYQMLLRPAQSASQMADAS
jgi:CHAD domain-containing protein